MRALVQRVKEGSVRINGVLHARIQRGIVILLGVKTGDSPDEAKELAEKCAALRIFEDDQGKMNLALKDVKGSALIVSQFTLYADTHKGNRPGFSEAARPEEAEALYETFVDRMRSLLGESMVRTGVFRAMMDVTILNDGPVTIMLESR